MAHWHRLGAVVGITALVGCGSPAPDYPTLAHTAESTDALVTPPTDNAAIVGQVANKPARQAPMQMSPQGAHITEASRALSPGPDAHAQSSTSPVDPSQSDKCADAERAQRDARQMWFAELREHSDVTVRLQALELSAQQPGDGLEPIAYALVDGDEHIRARAQQLWEQQLTRETAMTMPSKREGLGE
jgi:hypothetical protein